MWARNSKSNTGHPNIKWDCRLYRINPPGILDHPAQGSQEMQKGCKRGKHFCAVPPQCDNSWSKRRVLRFRRLTLILGVFTRQKVFVKRPYVPKNLNANNEKVKVKKKLESENGSMFRCLLIPASFTTSTKIIDASSNPSLIYRKWFFHTWYPSIISHLRLFEVKKFFTRECAKLWQRRVLANNYDNLDNLILGMFHSDQKI